MYDDYTSDDHQDNRYDDITSDGHQDDQYDGYTSDDHPDDRYDDHTSDYHQDVIIMRVTWRRKVNFKWNAHMSIFKKKNEYLKNEYLLFAVEIISVERERNQSQRYTGHLQKFQVKNFFILPNININSIISA